MTIARASANLKIIGREPQNEFFNAAHEAIVEAEFLGILGFGYDTTNVENLKLVELAAGKRIFSTGWDMGAGMRGWIAHLGLSDIYFGMPDNNVAKFLDRSAFFRWANTPGATSHAMSLALFGTGRRLPEY
jgi:hypothetical protein